jgi:thiamine-phosphate pyrophosphorylase
MSLSARRARLAEARLYFNSDARPGGRPLADVLPAALAGGVDLFQLRMKDAGDEEILAAAAVAREACDAAGALFILNDRPDLAATAGADGVHVGQDDGTLEQARAAAGPELLIGLSTHAPAEIDAGRAADYLGVGPVNATPTKPGRPAVGLELVEHAAAHAAAPFFAIGGIDSESVPAVLHAGARRIAVVRAIAEAADPQAAARELREWLEAADAAARPAQAREEPPAGGGRRPRRSSEERNAELRAELRPYAVGARPPALLFSAALAALLGVISLVAYAAGAEVNGRHPAFGGIVGFCGLMFISAAGMWAKRYWAVLLFQVILAATTVISFLRVLVASNLRAVVVSVLLVAASGWLFWKLVRVLARLQAPASPEPEGT